MNSKYYVESDDAYRFELKLIKHLHTQAVPVANAKPTENGDLLGIEKTQKGQRTFALFYYADGIPLSRDSVTIKQGYQMGVALANLHLAANSFECKYGRYKLDLKYLVDEPMRLVSEGEQCAELSDLIKRGQHVIEKLQPIDSYLSLIHI